MTDDSNLLDQEEWDTVYNALAHWKDIHPTLSYRAYLQKLMDKIRDSYLSYENPEDQQEISK